MTNSKLKSVKFYRMTNTDENTKLSAKARRAKYWGFHQIFPVHPSSFTLYKYLLQLREIDEKRNKIKTSSPTLKKLQKQFSYILKKATKSYNKYENRLLQRDDLIAEILRIRKIAKAPVMHPNLNGIDNKNLLKIKIWLQKKYKTELAVESLKK